VQDLQEPLGHKELQVLKEVRVLTDHRGLQVMLVLKEPQVLKELKVVQGQ